MRPRYLLDTCILVSLVNVEDRWHEWSVDKLASLLEEGKILCTLDLAVVSTVRILHRYGLDPRKAMDAVLGLLDTYSIGVQHIEKEDLDLAIRLSTRYNIDLYDCIFLAKSIRLNSYLVTTDVEFAKRAEALVGILSGIEHPR